MAQVQTKSAPKVARALTAALGVVALAAGLLVAPGGSVQTAEAATGCSSTPFKSGKGHWYRIPAVVSTGSNRVLAFAERRDNNSASDRGNFDVVMRASTNGGCTWGEIKTVANDGGNRVSNAVPIWDAATNTVLLFTSIRRMRPDVYKGLYLQRISPDGSSWTSLLGGKVTVPSTATRRWKGGLTGPGHGIVLTKGANAGRIIFAMGYKNQAGYGGYGIYSDDHGASWQIGYDRLAPSKMQLMEGTIAETASGDLVVSYRDRRQTKPGTNRVYATSTDQGLSIGTYRRMGVKTVAVEGSLLQTTGAKSVLLFSSPSYVPKRPYATRRNMRIFISYTAGRTWRPGTLVGTKGWPAAYSDLTQVNDNTIGILYETGKSGAAATIMFRQIPLGSIR